MTSAAMAIDDVERLQARLTALEQERKHLLAVIEILQDVPAELKGRVDTIAESQMRGHLQAAEGAEQTGSQSYVPPEEKDDKALHAAYDFLHGVTANAVAAKPAPKAAVPN